jgi:hypothetical protein
VWANDELFGRSRHPRPPEDERLMSARVDLALERQILGACVLGAGAVHAVRKAGLKPEHLYSTEHREILDAIYAVGDRDKPELGPDEHLVHAELERRGSDISPNRAPELAAEVDAPGNAGPQAERVVELAELRLAHDAGHAISKAAEDGDWAAIRKHMTAVPTGTTGGDGPQLLDEEGIRNLPPVEYLVDGILIARGQNGLFGPSGAGKSFMAQDLSLSIATGRHWQGKKVQQGPVVYVAGEGAGGFRQRIDAWKDANGVEELADFYLYPEPVNCFHGDTGLLRSRIAALPNPPVLIVFDTVARCMVGGDENSARDMGLFVESAHALAREFDAAFLTVHHSAKADPEQDRGSGALRAALDQYLNLKPTRTGLRLSFTKQKDAAKSPALDYRLEQVGESAVLRSGNLTSGPEQVTPAETELVQAISELFSDRWVSVTEVSKAAGVSRPTAWRRLKALCEAKKVEEREGGRRGKEYRVVTPSPSCSEQFTAVREPAKSCSVHPPSLEEGGNEQMVTSEAPEDVGSGRGMSGETRGANGYNAYPALTANEPSEGYEEERVERELDDAEVLVRTVLPGAEVIR